MNQKKAPRGAGLEITVIACLPKQAPEPDDDMRLSRTSAALCQDGAYDGSDRPGLVLSPMTYSW